MNIKMGSRDLTVPVRTTMELGGIKFEIELLPFSEKEQFAIFREFRKMKKVLNPVSKTMELIPYLDFEDGNDKKLDEKMEKELDRIVRNFWGIGDLEGNERDGTLKENKLLLGSIKVEDFEEIPIEDDTGGKAIIKQKRTRRFSALIFNEAARLAETIIETEIKNS